MPEPLPIDPESLIRHLDGVRRLAFRLVHNRDLADDVAQDTMVAALQNRRPLHRGLGPWLRGVTRRRAADAVRTEVRRRERERLAAKPESVPGAAEVVQRLSGTREVADALLALSEPHRRALYLRYFEGLPPRVIAQRLDLPVDTVKSHLKRGLAQMRAGFDARHGGGRPAWTAVLAPLLQGAAGPAAVGSGLASAAGGTLAMGLKLKLTIAVGCVLLGVALFRWVDESTGDRTSPEESPSVLGTAAQQASDALSRAGPRPGDGETPSPATDAGPVLQTNTRNNPNAGTPQTADGSWVVRGRVYLRRKTPAAGRQVIAKGYAGYSASGTAAIQAELVSDQDGRFAWALPPPTRPMRLVFSLKGGQAQDDCLALPGAPPPRVTLSIRVTDARVVGRVTDMEGRPIKGAEVIYYYRDPPILCAEDGSFEVTVSSVGGDAMLRAHGPGYASRRITAHLSGPGSKARIEFRLPREFCVTGVVTDPEGRPLEGAVVQSFMTIFTNRAVTDTHGAYTLHHLDPFQPRHEVFARHKLFTEARATVITRGASVRTDFKLGRGVRVEGIVTDADGAPLEGASLYIGFSPSARTRLDTLAQDGGRFVFPVVPAGAQTLVASRPGYASTRLVLQVSSDKDALANLQVVLQKGRTVSGRVETPDGKAVAGAHVSWTQEGEYTRIRVVTNQAGDFEAHHLPVSALGVEVYGSTFQRFKKSIPDGREPVTDLTLTVQPSGKLAGRVVDARTGEPLSAFVVRLVAPERRPGDKPASGYSATWSREGHRFNDTDGYWDTKGEQLTASGAYGVEVTADGYAVLTDRRVIARVEPAKDETVFQMTQGASLVGTIVDASTGSPIEGAVLKLFSAKNPLRDNREDVHGRKMTRSDATGRFQLLDLPEGDVRLQVTHPKYAPADHGPLSIEAGSEAQAGQIALSAGGGIEGVAADEDGRPLTGVRVEARFLAMDSPRKWTTTTDGEGLFRFDKLPPGRFIVWRIRAGHSGPVALLVGVTYSVRIQVEEGKHTRVRLAPSGSATIQGRIVFDGVLDLPPDLHIWLEPIGEPQRPGRHTLAVNGAFSFGCIEPGAYAIRCEHYQTLGPSRLQSWSGHADVRLAQEETKDVELKITVR